MVVICILIISIFRIIWPRPITGHDVLYAGMTLFVVILCDLTTLHYRRKRKKALDRIFLSLLNHLDIEERIRENSEKMNVDDFLRILERSTIKAAIGKGCKQEEPVFKSALNYMQMKSIIDNKTSIYLMKIHENISLKDSVKNPKKTTEDAVRKYGREIITYVNRL
jgi:hypothetical protein